jgi:O-antigen/teichoic acid export membrane protein
VVVAALGFDAGITYLVSQDRWSPRRAFLESQAIALGLGALGVAVGYGIFRLAPGAFSGVDSELMLLTLAGLPFALMWLLAAPVPLALDRYEAHAAPIAGQALLALALTVPLALADDLRGAIVAWSASHAVVAVAYAAWLWTRLPDRRPAAQSARPALDALRFGSQTYVNNVLQFLNYRVDLFILVAVVGASAEVGHYAVAATIVTALWMIPWAVSSVLLPRVAALSGADEAALSADVEGRALRHTVLVMAVSCVALVPILLVGVPLVYGADFRPAATLAILLLPGVACSGVATVLVSATAGRGHPRYAMVTGLLTAPVALALYVVLIEADGATGAALGSTLSYAFSFLVAALLYRRATGLALAGALRPTAAELHDYRVALADLLRILRPAA